MAINYVDHTINGIICVILLHYYSILLAKTRLDEEATVHFEKKEGTPLLHTPHCCCCGNILTKEIDLSQSTLNNTREGMLARYSRLV
jgi:hypothetical protein